MDNYPKYLCSLRFGVGEQLSSTQNNLCENTY